MRWLSVECQPPLLVVTPTTLFILVTFNIAYRIDLINQAMIKLRRYFTIILFIHNHVLTNYQRAVMYIFILENYVFIINHQLPVYKYLS